MRLARHAAGWVVLAAMLTGAAPAAAQPGVVGPPLVAPEVAVDPSLQVEGPGGMLGAGALDADGTINPLGVLSGAARGLPGADGSADSGLSTAMNIVLLLTVISLAPSIMLMTTCFVRIIVVLGLLRQALGTQNLPPPQVITGLALFMTFLVMAPTFDRVYNEAIMPYRAGEITDYETLWNKAKQPMRDFMFAQIDATGDYSSLLMVLNHRGVDTSDPEMLRREDVDMVTLIPAYMLSELKVAFLMGFRVYLPFLVIDMVISSLLISMSMMMLPPVLISLPFKVLLFVLADGWTLVVGSLMSSFVVPGVAAGGGPAG